MENKVKRHSSAIELFEFHVIGKNKKNAQYTRTREKYIFVIKEKRN